MLSRVQAVCVCVCVCVCACVRAHVCVCPCVYAHVCVCTYKTILLSARRMTLFLPCVVIEFSMEIDEAIDLELRA